MTKRIFVIFIAVLILALSVPVFAVESFSTWNVAGIYAGSLDSAMSQERYSDAWQYIVDNATGNLATWVTSSNYKTFGVVSYVDYLGYDGEVRIVFFRSLSSFDELRFSSDDDTRKTRPYNSSSGATATSSNFIRLQVRADASDWANGNFTNLYGVSGDTASPYISPLLKPSNTYTQQDLFLDQSIPLYNTATSQILSYPVAGYSGPASITLQPGNLLIFEKSGGFVGVDDITITANDLPISPFIGPWETRNSIGSSATLPDDSTPLGTPYTQWSKVEGSENWLGRSTRGIYSWQISQYTDDYAYYLNPIFGFNVGGFDFIGSGGPDYNPPNVVRIPDVSAFDKIYLIPTINRAGQSYIDYSGGSVIYDVSFDDNGTPEFIPEGSDTPSSDANRPGGVTDISGSAGATTQGLIARILEFLESGIDRFASVAEAGRSFLESISSIFSWIPIEIRTVLTSGIIIVIMMAVLSRFI